MEFVKELISSICLSMIMSIIVIIGGTILCWGVVGWLLYRGITHPFMLDRTDIHVEHDDINDPNVKP